MNNWRIKPLSDEQKQTVNDYIQKCDLSKIVLEIMVGRGMSYEDIVDFFQADELSSPFELKDMQKAVNCINEAITAGEKICIYGDYDCDGVTSTSLLYMFLQSLGADVIYYIPERSAGYGLNKNAIDDIAEMGTKLIITVDNGITAIDEAKYIYEKDMKLVITDHHQPLEEIPQAEAVVDAHQTDCPSKFKDLAGVGIAFKLAVALSDGDYNFITEQYSDVCAIGTVADIVPLKGENRTIVQKGLFYIKNTENVGIHKLAEKAGLNLQNITSLNIGFGLAPRINASGRFGSPLTATQMLTTDDCEKSVELASELDSLNNQRKLAQQKIFNDIVSQIQEDRNILNQRVLVISGENWHHGVIGIVSSNILELFGKPNIIISSEDDEFARGSARSIKSFNMFKCLEYCGDLLEKFGGHECAGGLTIAKKNIPAFIQRVNKYAFENNPTMPKFTIKADKILEGSDIDIQQVESLEKLEPFGEQNEQPIFAIIGARVTNIVSLSGGKHSKADVIYCNKKFSILIFGKSPSQLGFFVGEKVDFLVTMEINIFNGNKSISVKAKDYRLTKSTQAKYFASLDCYEQYKRGEQVSKQLLERITPTRQDIANFYTMCQKLPCADIDNIYIRLSHIPQLADSMNFAKIRFIVDILEELGLMKYNVASKTANVIPTDQKMNLDDSKTLQDLRKKLEMAE